jgi:hypothetical protein
MALLSSTCYNKTGTGVSNSLSHRCTWCTRSCLIWHCVTGQLVPDVSGPLRLETSGTNYTVTQRHIPKKETKSSGLYDFHCSSTSLPTSHHVFLQWHSLHYSPLVQVAGPIAVLSLRLGRIRHTACIIPNANSTHIQAFDRPLTRWGVPHPQSWRYLTSNLSLVVLDRVGCPIHFAYAIQTTLITQTFLPYCHWFPTLSIIIHISGSQLANLRMTWYRSKYVVLYNKYNLVVFWQISIYFSYH